MVANELFVSQSASDLVAPPLSQLLRMARPGGGVTKLSGILHKAFQTLIILEGHSNSGHVVFLHSLGSHTVSAF